MGKNSEPKARTLDLHGYKAEDVEMAVDRFLMQVSGDKRARIMTGKGTGAVQKIVIEYLKMAGYHWKFEEMDNGKKNTGVLVLFLD